jgi:acyl-CoA reductase-like NAD-dependent aldehyde dehydrogenase
VTILKCISPIDGSVYAERPTQSYEEASAAIAKARAARS